MTVPAKIPTQNASLTRDLLLATRYYLGRPRVLLGIAAIAVTAGLALNWSWLVAAGLAPILLSTLPCLVMCAFGVCMMCRSGDKDAVAQRTSDTAGTTTMAAISSSPSAAASCCHGAADEPGPAAAADSKLNKERTDSHA